MGILLWDDGETDPFAGVTLLTDGAGHAVTLVTVKVIGS